MNLETLTTSIVFANAMLFIGIGAIIGAGVLVIINNVFHRYWKPISFFQPTYIEMTEELDHEYTKQSRRSKKDRVSTTGNQQQPDQN